MEQDRKWRKLMSNFKLKVALTTVMPGKHGIDEEQSVETDSDSGLTRRGLLKGSALGIAGLTTAGGVIDSLQAASSDPGDPAPADSEIGGGALYDDTLTSADANYTVSNTKDLDYALRDAGSGNVIWIEGNATVDLGDWTRREIPSGVTLASDRGQNGSRGGKIRIDDGHDGLRVGNGGLGVLEAKSDVRITGVQFEGPSTEHFSPSDTWGQATVAVFVGSPNVEIDNCEFWGFTNAGVRAGHVRRGIEAKNTHVHHCSFHDNAMKELGYGVICGITSSGSNKDYPGCLIGYNYFTRNRHSIAGNGGKNCNYTARYNLNDSTMYGHSFDMHEGGSDNNAGGDIHYHHNTIKHHEDGNPGIALRNKVYNAADIWNNWFYDPDRPGTCSTCNGSGSTAINQIRVDGWDGVWWADRDNHFGGDTEPALDVGHPRGDWTVADGFEDGDISEYSGWKEKFSVITSPTYEGSYALEANVSATSAGLIHDNLSVSRGDTIRYRQYCNSSTSDGFQLFKQSSSDSGYHLNIDAGAGELTIQRYDSGVATNLVSESVSVPTGEWLESNVTAHWDGTITWTLYDGAGDKLAGLDASDTTYDSGTIMWRAYEGAKWDSLETARPWQTIENFEDGGIAEYSGDTGSFSVVSSPTQDGIRALETTVNETLVGIDHDGLSVSQGTDLQYRQYCDANTDAGLMFFKQSSSDSGYYCAIDATDGQMLFRRLDSGSKTLLASTSVTIPTSEWLLSEVTTDSDGTLTWALYDASGNQLGSLSATDSTYTAGTIQWRAWEGAAFDNLKRK